MNPYESRTTLVLLRILHYNTGFVPFCSMVELKLKADWGLHRWSPRSRKTCGVVSRHLRFTVDRAGKLVRAGRFHGEQLTPIVKTFSSMLVDLNVLRSS